VWFKVVPPPVLKSLKKTRGEICFVNFITIIKDASDVAFQAFKGTVVGHFIAIKCLSGIMVKSKSLSARSRTLYLLTSLAGENCIKGIIGTFCLPFGIITIYFTGKIYITPITTKSQY
jgi:hypothetical protein